MSLARLFYFKKANENLKSPKEIVLYLVDEKRSSSEKDSYLDELMREPELFKAVIDELAQLGEQSEKQKLATFDVMKVVAKLLDLHLNDEPSGKHLDPYCVVTLSMMWVKYNEITKRRDLYLNLLKSILNKLETIHDEMTATNKHVSTP